MAFNILQDTSGVGEGGELTTAQESNVSSVSALGASTAGHFLRKTSSTAYESVATAVLSTGTSGIDFNISTTGTAHTLNIPDASATARGLVTTGTQTIAGDKTFLGDITIQGAITSSINQTISGDVAIEVTSPTAFDVKDAVGASIFLVNTDNGNVFVGNDSGLVIGHTAQVTGISTPELQVLGTGGVDSSMLLARFSSNANPPAIDFVKSRNATIGLSTIVQDNDVVGRIRYLPDDGSPGNYDTLAATFDTEVDDGSPAVGDIGMAFVWMQMPGGGGALAEKMRISAAGTLTVVGDVLVSGVIRHGAAGSLTIATGVVAVTKTYHTIVVENGTGSGADALVTATGGAEGDRLILKAATTGANDQITVTNGTGSDTFILAGGADFVMDHIDDRIELIHNGTEWVELTRSDNS